MKARLALPIGIAIGAVVAVSVTALMRSRVEATTNVQDPQPIFEALFRLADAPIKDWSCEPLPPLTVGAVMGQYSGFSFRPSSTAFQALNCEGQRQMKCILSFGQAKDIEGGARLLTFSYNSETKAVDAESLKCADIP
jgi:hypothetical protein